MAADYLNHLGLSGGAMTDGNSSSLEQLRQSLPVDAKLCRNLRKRRSLTLSVLGNQEVALSYLQHPAHRPSLRSCWSETPSADLAVRSVRPSAWRVRLP